MFMISGYLSYIVYSSKIVLRQLSMERFYFHRFSRMFLGLVISSTVMEIGQLIYISHYGTYWVTDNNDLWHFLMECFGTHMWIDSNPAVNGPAWFISVLLFLDIIFFLLTRLSVVAGNMIFVVPIFAGVFITSQGWNYPLFNTWTGEGLYSFFIGVVIGIIYDKAKNGEVSLLERKKTRLLIYVCVIILIIVFTRIVWMVGNVSYVMAFLLFPTLIMYALNEKSAEVIFGNKLMRALGKISYGMYIWNQPIELWWVLFNKKMNIVLDYDSLSIFFLHMLLNIIAGIIWYYFEGILTRKIRVVYKSVIN